MIPRALLRAHPALRFALVGASGFVVDTTVLILLYEIAAVELLLARSIAFVVALSPYIPHDLEGRETCLVCHDTAGEIRPAPSNHGDYIDAQCTLCHKLE